MTTLWDELRTSFRDWTGMLLPDPVKTSAMVALEELAAKAGLSPAACLRRMDEDAPSQQLLLDRIGLGLTWFMRERDALDTVVRALASDAADRADASVWVWSAGCSSGEEAYSLAMALLEAGYQPRILATDLNRDALQRGIQGRYRLSAVRNVPFAWRERYMHVEGDRVRMKPSLRRCITFALHNFAQSPDPPAGWPPFDAVVCRNALMYFTRDDAARIIRRFAKASRPNGHLVLGAIERPLAWIAGDDLSSKSNVAVVKVPRFSPLRTTSSRAPARETIRPPFAGAPAPVAPPRDDALVDDLLQRADRLMRAGQIDQALAALDEALQRNPISPAAHLSRGLLHKRCKRIPEAICDLRAARFLEDGAWLAPYSLGACLDLLGEHDEARSAYRHALSVLEAGGPPGMRLAEEDLRALALTAAQACRHRIGRRR